MLDLLNQEYTLVGVLVVGVVAIWLFLRGQLREEREFMVGQIDAANEERKGHVQALAEVSRSAVAVNERTAAAIGDMTKEMVTAQKGTAAVLSGLQEEIKEYSVQRAEEARQGAMRDEQVAHLLDQVCNRLDAKERKTG